MLTDLPAPVEPAMSTCGIVARSADERVAVNALAERERKLRRRPDERVRFQQFTERDRLAVRIRNLDADRGLARDPIDQHRIGLHRQAEIVGQARDAAVFHAGVGLEFVGRHDRTRMNLDDRAFHGKFAALLFEQPRRIHQFAFVNLVLVLGSVEQREGRRRVAALAPFGRDSGRRPRRRAAAAAGPARGAGV